MQAHTFHIPVMGLGYTVDTPIKVAHYGIDSVISIVDDWMIEIMRKIYSNKLNIDYNAITDKVEDYRAKRITAYLDIVDLAVKKKVEQLKNSIEETMEEFNKYIEMLPDLSELKTSILKFLDENPNISEIKEWISSHIKIGEIDVNIMTKLDNVNYKNGEKLPNIYNDAHAALRGFAHSKLNSSLVLSAGMNPKLYTYLESFEDFYPNEKGELNKKIILKVSDYRSALIQGKFLAKKGIWVSEFRIESGLNCGGHAFATDGYLLGPILEEFKNNRLGLKANLFDIYKEALSKKDKAIPSTPLNIKLTVQGGVGTSEEHDFLLEEYNLDSIGWGSPFLLVSEAISIDEETQELLRKSSEEDFYMSDVSPLGVKFNNVRGASKDLEKQNRALEGKPGSACPKKFLTFNTEYSEKPICTASTKFQIQKIDELTEQGLCESDFLDAKEKIADKSCLCVGLSSSALLAHQQSDKLHGATTLVCPGPNLAYFNQKVSLKEMVNHIYGKIDLLKDANRPNMFVKELKLYIQYLSEKIEEYKPPLTGKQEAYISGFKNNLLKGIEYYKSLNLKLKDKFQTIQESFSNELDSLEERIIELRKEQLK